MRPGRISSALLGEKDGSVERIASSGDEKYLDEPAVVPQELDYTE